MTERLLILYVVEEKKPELTAMDQSLIDMGIKQQEELEKTEKYKNTLYLKASKVASMSPDVDDQNLCIVDVDDIGTMKAYIPHENIETIMSWCMGLIDVSHKEGGEPANIMDIR